MDKLASASGGHLQVNIYGYVPNFAANVVGLSLFAVAWLLHTVFGLYYRQWWFGTAVWIACGLETAGYVARTLSHANPTVINDYLVQIICLTLGPAFAMAGIYYMLAKFTVIYGGQFSKLKPMAYSTIFILFDFISIVLQAIGGGMAAVALLNHTSATNGTHVMLAGICFQVVSMLIFMFFCAWFVYNITFGPTKYGWRYNAEYADLHSRKLFIVFPWSIGVAVLAIFTRCIYRVVELAQGWTGYLITHEQYFLALDGLMLIIALFALLLPHPGFVWGRRHIKVEKFGRPQPLDQNKEG
ncbi:hypothetical protein BZG36_04876 [Bifiguratus adelaidae]|uniref:RTA1-domain-containing protein n=1 Tax=Bifiguratus adelaidae TaxID=1938954 RepID=A0A261XVK0_9FUNG|nr:hypothetical protein BZG36_04876 [Bifiguratus adelaidae]